MIPDENGNAAAEMAMLVPLLLILGMGSIEVGNYTLAEHRLTQAVRDGARYAARQDFSEYSGCTATPTTFTPTWASGVQNVVRTGQPGSGGADDLPNWSTGTITIAKSCPAASYSGIYTSNGNQAPVVTITARVPYAPIAVFGLGVNFRGYYLNSSQQAAVMGV